MPIEPSPFDAEFDALVEETLEEWKTPGLSIAVVHGSNTYSKAYGIAEFPDRKMTTDTLFPTASTTKAFLAAATSMMIQESKSTQSPLEWDTPISSMIPDDFVLADEYVTAHTTLEDALSHRSGLPGHQWIFHFGSKDASVREFVRSCRYKPLSAPPRTKFQYSNANYIAVTHALEQHTGETLEAFMKKRIWEPLGMNATYLAPSDAENDPSVIQKLVKAYTWIPEQEAGRWFSEPKPYWKPNTGGGAIVSNVLDYARWIRELLEQTGPLKGHDSLVKPRILHYEDGDINIPAPYHAYALGWFVDNYRGQHLYTHAGGWVGYGHLVGFIPDKKFGFVIMSNAHLGRFVDFKLAIHLLDKLLGPSDDPLHKERMAACFSKQAEARDKQLKYQREDIDVLKRQLFPTLADPPIPHILPLEKYVGAYRHPADAWFNITLDHARLTIDAAHGAIPGRFVLTHASGEFFIARITNPNIASLAPVAIEFEIDVSGAVRRVGLDIEPCLKGEKIWFDRTES
ncbi:hypothetical protein N7462_001890 [Penicillium macrosclerotiorum]|uniref:uncharacterized protein n=1 Tax=Penicillium macrosclerotiorum TaxID=303699 RepID=UPI002546C503|nr:uncharacterized protein N7462_001890 [Penicillium macrosclerotiorum]KAJ5692467.1 hypothetical protein N7462_001890 [Penicillium macrosclerotiorum]